MKLKLGEYYVKEGSINIGYPLSKVDLSNPSEKLPFLSYLLPIYL